MTTKKRNKRLDIRMFESLKEENQKLKEQNTKMLEALKVIRQNLSLNGYFKIQPELYDLFENTIKSAKEEQSEIEETKSLKIKDWKLLAEKIDSLAYKMFSAGNESDGIGFREHFPVIETKKQLIELLKD